MEIKGCGKNGLKIKLQSLTSLKEWNKYLTVWVFVYNSNSKKTTILTFQQLVDLCSDLEIKKFDNDGKLYYNVPVSRFTWEPINEE